MAPKARDIDRFLQEIKARSGALQDKERVEIQLPSRDQRHLIDLVASYISRCGHPFEEKLIDDVNAGILILPRRLSWDFLQKANSGDGKYYRWRTYAYTQGDSGRRWRVEPFQILRSGKVWVPPRDNRSRSRSRDRSKLASGKLSYDDRHSLKSMLNHLDVSRGSIADAMIWCLNRADAAEEITELICLPRDDSCPHLFLASDILHNSCSSAPHAWSYRKHFEELLPDFFLELKAPSNAVQNVFESWKSVSLFPHGYTRGLETCFLYGTLDQKECGAFLDAHPEMQACDNQHFSQLEKLCKARGLPYNSAKCFGGRPTEEERKRWLSFLLAAWAVHSEESIPFEDLDGEVVSGEECDTFPEYDVPRARDLWLEGVCRQTAANAGTMKNSA